jgi:hypothetical protein
MFMENEKLTKKIKRVSKVIVCAMAVYLLLNVLNLLPDSGSNTQIIMQAKEQPFWKAALGLIAIAVLIASIIGAFVSALQVMYTLSRNRTPFTNKAADYVRNLGIYFIAIEISSTLFIYLADGRISLDLFWLAGLIMYSFSLVFRYGKDLQQQSDETL